ncbi:putative inorganic phosphate cotransporter [Epargyreus clarus]|uniref:putative inorganic phosphate cotransporter n=1 Tax=Epargyreus clarus TaxID=520877 RepID=UPI003C2F33B0
MKDTKYTEVPIKENNKETTEEPSEYGYGVRHVQSLLFFMCLALGYISRAQLGVTIVAMTSTPTNETYLNVTNNILEEDNSINILTLVNNETVIFSNNEAIRFQTYDWPKSTQEMVMGAFFIGYLLMMFPIGLVCQRWGGKIPLQICLFLNGIISIGSPWLTAWGGWRVLCGCRVVQGLAQSGLYPSLHTLLANWVPINERGRLSSYVYTGSVFGTIVAFQLGGVLSDSRWGWPSTFWTSGLMCLIGLALLTVFGANKPAEHRTIPEEEKRYILRYSKEDDNKVSETKSKTPWKKILTSRHVWACFSANVGTGASLMFFLTQVPTYMHAILGFDIKNSGLLSSLPYIMAFFATITFGNISDFCTNRKILSIKNARIISNTIGTVFAAICLSSISYTQNSTLGVILFIMTMSCHTAFHTGWLVNYIDLAPNYSGAMMAFGNTIGNSVVIFVPFVVSSIVTDVTNPFQWRIIFLLVAGLLVMSNVFFVLFMSADIQSWNYGETNEPEEAKLEEHSEKK